MLDYALKNSVQELFLFLDVSSKEKEEDEEEGEDDEEKPFVMPYCFEWPRRFVCCQSLQKLVLIGSALSWIRLPKDLVLPALKYLTITRLGFSKDRVYASSFPTCPNLEELRLSEILTDDELTIVAPSLRKFQFGFLESDPTQCKVLIVAPRLTTFEYCNYWPMSCSFHASSSFEDVCIVLHPLQFEVGNKVTITDDFIMYAIQMLNEFRITKSMTINVKAIKVNILLLGLALSNVFPFLSWLLILNAYDCKVLSANPALLDGHLSKFDNLKCVTVEKDSCEDLESFPVCLSNYFLSDSTELKFKQPKW